MNNPHSESFNSKGLTKTGHSRDQVDLYLKERDEPFIPKASDPTEKWCFLAAALGLSDLTFLALQ